MAKNQKAKNPNNSQANAARKKSLEERMAAQRAAALAARRKRIMIIGGAALVVVTAIILTVVLLSGGKTAGMSDGVQTVSTTMTARGSSDITVKAGIPVKWSIRGSGGLGCMNAVKSGLFSERAVRSGQTTTVSFTPSAKGSYTVVCEHGNYVCTIRVT